MTTHRPVLSGSLAFSPVPQHFAGLPQEGCYKTHERASCRRGLSSPRLNSNKKLFWVVERGLEARAYALDLQLLQRETVQECKISREPGQAIGQDEYSDGYNQGTANHFDGMKMLFETPVESQELIQGQACQQKGDAEAGRVDG